MEKDQIKDVVRQVVTHLVYGNYDLLAVNDYLKLIGPEDIQLAVDEYPGKISLPPDKEYDSIDIYTISDKEIAIDFDLWYDNEKSELTLSCNLKEIDGKIEYTIEGIHIL